MNNIEREEKFQEIISKILTQLGLSATIMVDTVEINDKEYFKVDLEGEELSVLIGHHGRTMESLKRVLMLVAPTKEDGELYPVLLDVNNYHSQREDYIRNLCVSIADQVRLTSQSMELMPMKPSERRIVHMVFQDQDDIATESIGEGRDRRVVVKPNKSN